MFNIDYNCKRPLLYQTAQGEIPFDDWFTGLRDSAARAKIQVRLRRITAGCLGDFKNIGLGIFELRAHWGPGYRIYFGVSGRDLFVLLWGGIKKTQGADIRKATEYWQDYLRRKK